MKVSVTAKIHHSTVTYNDLVYHPLYHEALTCGNVGPANTVTVRNGSDLHVCRGVEIPANTWTRHARHPVFSRRPQTSLQRNRRRSEALLILMKSVVAQRLSGHKWGSQVNG